jgi:hypothetical protein
MHSSRASTRARLSPGRVADAGAEPDGGRAAARRSSARAEAERAPASRPIRLGLGYLPAARGDTLAVAASLDL